MVGTAPLLGLSVLICLTEIAVSLASKCRVASFRVIGSFSNSCDIQFGYTTAPPDWIDQLEVVQSFMNASEGQLDAFAKDVCRCRMLRVHRHCPSDLFELIKSVAWRCFPRAREAVKKGIADTITRQRQHGNKEASEDRVYQQGSDGSGDGGHGSQKSSEEEETQVEEADSEEMPIIAPDAEIITTNQITGITEGTDGSGDIASVESVDDGFEEYSEGILENGSENSSVGITETPIITEVIDEEGSGESFESVTVYGSNGIAIDNSKGSAAASAEGSGNGTDIAVDSGSGEADEEGYEQEGSAESLEGSSGEEAY